MNKFRRLKKEKINNKIKSTSCALALALAIGSTQGLGTHALFTDTADISDKLFISTGDVAVDAILNEGDDFTVKILQDAVYIPISITNEGTLNQNIKLDLVFSECVKSYEFVFDELELDKEEKSSVPRLYLEDGLLYEENGGLFIFPSAATLKGYIILTMEENIPSNLKGTIQLKVTSTQIKRDNNLVENENRFSAIAESTINVTVLSQSDMTATEEEVREAEVKEVLKEIEEPSQSDVTATEEEVREAEVKEVLKEIEEPSQSDMPVTEEEVREAEVKEVSKETEEPSQSDMTAHEEEVQIEK